MAKRKKSRQPPAAKRNAGDKSMVAFLSADDFLGCCSSGRYVRLDKMPEIVGIVRRFAEVVGGMTIHLMQNTDDGDVRIRNELSKFLDITPCSVMNRAQFVEYIIAEMLIRGNAVVRPKTRAGILRDLQPIPHGRFNLNANITGYDYTVTIDGVKYEPDEVLHFVYNPDDDLPFIGRGLALPLRELAASIKAGNDLQDDFMTSKYYPSLIVKADAVTEDFQSKEGREKIAQEYLETTRAGRPLVIPADLISIEQIKPFSLADLAIDSTTEFNHKKLAALFGVPPFFLGVGQYNAAEWNNFIQTKVRTFALYLGQEMTRKLIYKPEWYIRFNYLSILDFDIEKKGNIYLAYSDRGYVNGNEARNAIGIEPADNPALKEYTRLENYIPAAMSGDQKKLNQE